MKIREETKIVANDDTIICCKKVFFTYKSNYNVTLVKNNEQPKSHICHDREEAVREIIRLLKLAGWKLSKIRKL